MSRKSKANLVGGGSVYAMQTPPHEAVAVASEPRPWNPTPPHDVDTYINMRELMTKREFLEWCVLHKLRAHGHLWQPMFAYQDGYEHRPVAIFIPNYDAKPTEDGEARGRGIFIDALGDQKYASWAEKLKENI